MRVVAGQFRGRRLLGPKGRATRPITDRVKTACFSILGEAVEQAVVVDLFCGTGSLGLEAVSRGAERCWFAERDPGAIDRLRRNIEAMGVGDRCVVWRGDVLRRLARWLRTLAEPVDLAFVDPPYGLVEQWRWCRAAGWLFDPLADHLAEEATVIFRCRRNIEVPTPLGPLCVRDRRDYGTMSLVFLGRESRE